MCSFNRKEQLKRLHTIRKQETKVKVEAAIKRLTSKMEKINFNSVAKEAGISKTTLYKYPEYKNRINSFRNQQQVNITENDIDRSQVVVNEYLKNQLDKLTAENSILKQENKKLKRNISNFS